ncbi:MAG: MaoC family dehydratase [Pseudomonadota bacterium]
MNALDLFTIGDRFEIGSHTFEPEEIIAFAKRYDPQLFHIDPEAAKHSMLGGLCASGWHVTSAWMRVNVEYHRAEHARLKAEGKAVPDYGPSPGISNLKWLRPTFAGDTLRFFNKITDARKRRSNPQWGLLELWTDGINQHGDTVVEFNHTVLFRL